ncbi:MAG: helix-turn-helix domain-containing protein [Leptolyngbyaceae cyanobacterium SM1_1_3]|nr:helix-turn-helix domain-containing protein [Leptolyngbyaceae cyanobacterium SM1_1_3]
MPAPLRIILSEEEERTLRELREAQSVPYRTRDRAHMLRLNAQGLNVPAIADIFRCHQHNVLYLIAPSYLSKLRTLTPPSSPQSLKLPRSKALRFISQPGYCLENEEFSY